MCVCVCVCVCVCLCVCVCGCVCVGWVCVCVCDFACMCYRHHNVSLTACTSLSLVFLLDCVWCPNNTDV